MESSKEEVERLYERPDLGAYHRRPLSKRGNHMALASYPAPVLVSSDAGFPRRSQGRTTVRDLKRFVQRSTQRGDVASAKVSFLLYNKTMRWLIQNGL